MKGTVLLVEDKSIIIRGDDGVKYDTTFDTLRSDITPKVGDPVDLEIINGEISEVFILRPSHAIDDYAEKAKSAAGNIYKNIKKNVNQENVSKVKGIAQQQGKKIAESINTIDYANISEKIKESGNKISFYNKFAVASLFILVISLYLPIAANHWIGHVSYSKLMDGIGVQVFVLILALLAFGLGAPKFVSKLIGIFAILSVIYPLFELLLDFYDQVQQLNQFGLDKYTSSKSLIKTVTDSISWGAFVLLFSIIISAISLFKPTYQVNALFREN